MLKNKKVPAWRQAGKIKNQNYDLKFKISVFVLCFSLSLFPFFLLCYAQSEFVYDAKGKRNPFIPLVTNDGRLLKLDTEEGTTSLSLEGIIYDKYGRSYAIINGTVVGIGDILEGDYQVLKIEENKVIFIKGGETMAVELKKEEE